MPPRPLRLCYAKATTTPLIAPKDSNLTALCIATHPPPAAENIAPFTELTLDYGAAYVSGWPGGCKCGAVNCVSKLPAQQPAAREAAAGEQQEQQQEQPEAGGNGSEEDSGGEEEGEEEEGSDAE